DAMAGPTPVSALIHAATMVTAGLYMLTRTNVIFQHSQTMMLVVAVVGALTAIFAATVGITQNDIKKVLAYSTVSQLGFMFLAAGVGAFVVCIFHVMTHAFFKALMFLGAGSVIHGMHHEQDMRRMGNLRKYMPKTYLTFLAGWLAICGIIPFAGFWSKDEILWNAASTSYVPGGWMLWLIGTVAATCTAFYMTRLVAMTFWGRERFLEVPAGGQADEAHAQAYADGETAAHAAHDFSAGDRPHHGPEERVGIEHMRETEQFGAVSHRDVTGRDVHDVHAPEDAHGHGAHGHGSVVPHESPASMWVPLAVLAALSVVGGLVGIGPAFKALTGSEHPGGRFHIVNWLNPVIYNPVTKKFDRGSEAGGHAGREGDGRREEGGPLLASKEVLLAQGTEAHSETAARDESGARAATPGKGASDAHAPYGDTGFNLAHAAEETFHSHTAAEWLFIVVSLVVAGLGILLGLLFYVKNPRLPEAWAARLGPLYRASFNKYWIDELYAHLFTRRTMDAARAVFAADSKAVDGAVNGSAWLTRTLSRLTGNTDRYVVDGLVNTVAGFIRTLMSPLIRAAHTGLTANYALAMVLGLVVVVVVLFARDIM
ncbi:MAG TPA: proton-conducting transporter membrane subunit, partial [Pyrinomonadaceae bacterium]|nr:proton-conducting transporter membrane subunit [Pyrinomonadaceae bacterium]